MMQLVLMPIVNSVFLTPNLRNGRLVIGWQAASRSPRYSRVKNVPACHPIANRLPLDFRIRKHSAEEKLRRGDMGTYGWLWGGLGCVGEEG